VNNVPFLLNDCGTYQITEYNNGEIDCLLLRNHCLKSKTLRKENDEAAFLQQQTNSGGFQQQQQSTNFQH